MGRWATRRARRVLAVASLGSDSPRSGMSTGAISLPATPIGGGGRARLARTERSDEKSAKQESEACVHRDLGARQQVLRRLTIPIATAIAGRPGSALERR